MAYSWFGMAYLVLTAGVVVYRVYSWFGMVYLVLAASGVVCRVYSWLGMVYLVLTAGVVVYRVYSLVWHGSPGVDSRLGSVQSVQFGLAWLTWC